MCFKLTTGGETYLPRHSYGNRRLRLQFERALVDGHNNARNMSSSVYAPNQYILQLIVASGWVFLFEYLKMHGTTNPKNQRLIPYTTLSGWFL
jgi:hypothetical protein